MDEIGRMEESAGKTDLILALNSGSSSLKFAIYRVGESEERLVSGSAERIIAVRA